MSADDHAAYEMYKLNKIARDIFKCTIETNVESILLGAG